MMARNIGLPKPTPFYLTKSKLLSSLTFLDNNQASKDRVLKMEVAFRRRIESHVGSLPTGEAQFRKFNTSPFVLLFYSLQHGYSHIHQIEKAILPAKVFSSMETSAGRMVEMVVLPEYGWQIVPSEMHSVNSALDGKKLEGDTLHLATLKSGPRCLNDEMSENFADAIVNNFEEWALNDNVKNINFTYGVLYGTKKQSNKKDWHILRKIVDKLPQGTIIESPNERWFLQFKSRDIVVTVGIRIGIELWNHIAGEDVGFMELAVALIRACILPTEVEPEDYHFTITDLKKVISLDGVPTSFNVAMLQRSQLQWLFFFAFHFCDSLESGEWDFIFDAMNGS
ncbi:PmeII family type II restriction endonuclease [Schlesneria sp. DSM 10557]|uniref:PmeII family type II restriction endonuclease n=1 Tax=Schlesneria sp. DSM 10557 TaxID=3044399 RepID=UPI0035A1BC94